MKDLEVCNVTEKKFATDLFYFAAQLSPTRSCHAYATQRPADKYIKQHT
jgi:hypothetical protein